MIYKLCTLALVDIRDCPLFDLVQPSWTGSDGIMHCPCTLLAIGVLVMTESRFHCAKPIPYKSSIWITLGYSSLYVVAQCSHWIASVLLFRLSINTNRVGLIIYAILIVATTVPTTWTRPPVILPLKSCFFIAGNSVNISSNHIIKTSIES